MKNENRQAYLQHISSTYDERSGEHDSSKWHRKTALRLVKDMPPDIGDSVLDVATGTGTIAFKSAILVGSGGKVVGVDISKGMLAEANKKLSASGLDNLEFVLADAEHLEFPDNSFDRIYCASAFFCILEPLKTLRHWNDLLKPGGALCFHALPETSYFWVSIARSVLAECGYQYRLNMPTASAEKSQQLLTAAGFSKIDIQEEKSGYYVPFDDAIKSWLTEDGFTPGQYPHPLANVPPDILAQCQREYEERIKALNTDEGVWNDISMYYIYARKHSGT